MPDLLIEPDRPFVRVWRASHPLRPCVGKPRQAAMFILLVVLWLIIGGYIFLTNETRVRVMASNYLADLLGGQVDIQGADLSIFEGLRLEGVTIRVGGGANGQAPQSTILEAGAVFIHYNLRDLLAGRIAASQIIAVNPHVRLVEDLTTGHWNYESLNWAHGLWAPQGPASLQAMPEILLRGAQVEYVELDHAGAHAAGAMTVDGRFGPVANRSDRYEFSFQSRGREALGPTIDGSVSPAAGHVLAQLRNFVFGPDIRAMLPIQVQKWCVDHKLAGRMDLSLSYRLPTLSDSQSFRVEAALGGVALSVLPSEDPDGLALHNVFGNLIFTNDRLTVRDLTGWLGDNGFTAHGWVNGYSTNVPMDLSVTSIGELNIPPTLSYAASLPRDIRELYFRVRPRGKAAADVRVTRLSPSGPLVCVAQIDVLDGGFTFRDIPYPVSHATGRIVVGPDEKTGYEIVRMENIHGYGIPGGPNASAQITVNGWTGPLDPRNGGHIDVTGSGIHYEPALVEALPHPARMAMAALSPTFTASVTSLAQRKPGPPSRASRWTNDMDITVTDGSATYNAFAYRVDHVTGKLQVRRNLVNVIDVEARHGPAAVRLDGQIGWDEQRQTFRPDLKMTASDVRIDPALIAALPPQATDAVKKTGAIGWIDATGRLFNSDKNNQPTYDLNVALRDGSIWPDGKTAAATDIAGHLRVTPDRLDLVDLTARRGQATLSARGFVDCAGGARHVSVAMQADNLRLDDGIYQFLPAQGRDLWDHLNPSGTVDCALTYNNPETSSASSQVSVRPRDLSLGLVLAPQARPLQLDHVKGVVTLVPQREADCDLVAWRGSGRVDFSGTWNLADASSPLEFRLRGRHLIVDPGVIQSLPPEIGQVLNALGLNGQVGFDFSKLSYKPVSIGAKSLSTNQPDVDFAVHIDCEKAAMDIGVPLQQVTGQANLCGALRCGELRDLSGDISADSLLIAGRPASNLHATLTKRADQPIVQIKDLDATVADGQLAGNLAISLPTGGWGRYALSLILRDADVRELAGSTDDKLRGAMTASLSMSGSVTDAADRRGRGDLRIDGAQMYQIPLLLGLFQVADLSLPISSPFEKASASYSVQGQRVSLERILLSSKDMSMLGGGHIDFGSKTVDLTFTTNNPNSLAVPVLGPMWNGAKNELLRIHVKGTLESPHISASSMDTFTTTVDQVFGGQ